MPVRRDWDAHSAIAGLELEAWSGRVWRFHRRVYDALDAGGSLRVSGRYHQAPNQFQATWRAIYTALTPETALGEVLRHFTAELLPGLNRYRLTEVEVALTGVIDCRSAPAMGVEPSELTDDYEFVTTRAIATASIERGAEAILVPSATGLGDNLVVFPDQLQASSKMVIVGGRDPRLFVHR